MALYNISLANGTHAHEANGKQCKCENGKNEITAFFTQFLGALEAKQKREQWGIHFDLKNDQRISITPHKNTKHLLVYLFVMSTFFLGTAVIVKKGLGLRG